MRKLNLEGVAEFVEFTVLPAGSYIAKITNIEDVEEKEYLKVELDIADGQYKDHYKESKYKLNMYRSYKESALSFFKSFITAVQNSNENYKFNEEKIEELKGKLVGIVVGEEEYNHKNGGVRERVYIAQTRSIEEIKKGEIKIPELKRLEGSNNTSFTDVTDLVSDELPF